MASRRRLIRDRATWTATTDDLQIVSPKNLVGIRLYNHSLQDGATAPTLANILSQMSTIQLKLNGRIVSEITGEELYAFNCLTMGGSPIAVLGVVDNDQTVGPALRLPVNMPTGKGEVAIRVAFTDHATMDTQQISIEVDEVDAGLTGGYYSITRYLHTPPASAAYNIAFDNIFDGTIEGILIRSTTIPVVGSANTSARRVRLRVNSSLDVEALWETLKAGNQYPGNVDARGICDNFTYLDLSLDPIPAGARVEASVFADDTNEVRLLPITRVA